MRILEGIKVIDVTAWAFVPSAGGVLAHRGADVIKVESPNAPDPMRLMGGSLEPGGSSATFKHYSRGKRSIAINLVSHEGQELIYRLAADADVFLTSYLAPTRRKLGIDVEDIRNRSEDHRCTRQRSRPEGRTPIAGLRCAQLVVSRLAGPDGHGHDRGKMATDHDWAWRWHIRAGFCRRDMRSPAASRA